LLNNSALTVALINTIFKSGRVVCNKFFNKINKKSLNISRSWGKQKEREREREKTEKN
jgi:hypothetical protein